MTKNSFLWIHYGAQSLPYSLLNTSTSFSPLRSHGAGKYNVSCGPIFQYLPRLWPLTKHTPLVQLFICKKVSLGSPVTPNVPRYIEGMVGNSPSLIFLHSDRVLNLRYKKPTETNFVDPLKLFYITCWKNAIRWRAFIIFSRQNSALKHNRAGFWTRRFVHWRPCQRRNSLVCSTFKIKTNVSKNVRTLVEVLCIFQ